ncbi:MAG: hypothetical protein FJY85_16400 [Deltaproteobacteria bacterium]|nr:hypothetical protein [Deltaproteobacteria bacterium]
MKRVLAAAILVLADSLSAYAVKMTLFVDTDTFIARAKDIIVAECVSVKQSKESEDGLCPVKVRILRVLKGNKQPGGSTIATIYPMKPGTVYLLSSLGGFAHGTDFLAIPELSVVPLPRGFPLEQLDQKPLKAQVQLIFSRRVYEIEQELDPLMKERELLKRGLKDRQDDLYESKGELEIRRVLSVASKTDEGGIVYLELNGQKLEWSESTRGESGFLYFTRPGSNSPLWEFSPGAHPRVEDFHGKRLRARFYGMYSPGRPPALGLRSYNAITVGVGQVVLARTVDDPQAIYVLQVDRQDRDTERVYVRYAIHRD